MLLGRRRRGVVLAVLAANVGCGESDYTSALVTSDSQAESAQSDSTSGGSSDSDGEASPEPCWTPYLTEAPGTWSGGTAAEGTVTLVSSHLTMIDEGQGWTWHYDPSFAPTEPLGPTSELLAWDNRFLRWDGDAWTSVAQAKLTGKLTRTLDGQIWLHEGASLWRYVNGVFEPHSAPPLVGDYPQILAVLSDGLEHWVYASSHMPYYPSLYVMAHQIEGGLWEIAEWSDWGPAGALPNPELIGLDGSGAIYFWQHRLARRDPSSGEWTVRDLDFYNDNGSARLWALASGGVVVEPSGPEVYYWDGIGEVETIETGPVRVIGADPLWVLADDRVYQLNPDSEPVLVPVSTVVPSWPRGERSSASGGFGWEPTAEGVIQWSHGEPQWVSARPYVDLWVVPDQPGWGAVANAGATELWRIDGPTETLEVSTPTGVVLEDIWGRAADDVWAVGYRGATAEEAGLGPTRGVIWHYDGETWAEVESPNPDSEAYRAVSGGPDPESLVYVVEASYYPPWPVVHVHDSDGWTALGWLNFQQITKIEVVVADDQPLILINGGSLYGRGPGWWPAHEIWPDAPRNPTALAEDGRGGAWARKGDLLHHFDGVSWRSVEIPIDYGGGSSSDGLLIATPDGVVVRREPNKLAWFFRRACLPGNVASP